jgi:hypothetical protein
MNKKIYGIVIFKNYRVNTVVKISFSNTLEGICPVCLNETKLKVYDCGHVICSPCYKLTSIHCVYCRESVLIRY